MKPTSEITIPNTGYRIGKPVKLLIFSVGDSKFGALVEDVRTIIDLEEAEENIRYDSEVNCVYEKGKVVIQAINLSNLLSQNPNDNHENRERKLIVVKTNLNSLNGVIVDHIEGVGTFSGIYPFPFGIFKNAGSFFKYVVTSEEPWFEVVDFSKIIEIYGFQMAKVENV